MQGKLKEEGTKMILCGFLGSLCIKREVTLIFVLVLKKVQNTNGVFLSIRGNYALK